MRAELVEIVAVSDDQILGDGRGLLWRCPEDMAHFRRITKGRAVVMGSATCRLLGAPLQERACISFGSSTPPPGFHRASTVQETLRLIEQLGAAVAFVAGGDRTYQAFRPLVRTVILSRIAVVASPLAEPEESAVRYSQDPAHDPDFTLVCALPGGHDLGRSLLRRIQFWRRAEG